MLAPSGLNLSPISSCASRTCWRHAGEDSGESGSPRRSSSGHDPSSIPPETRRGVFVVLLASSSIKPKQTTSRFRRSRGAPAHRRRFFLLNKRFLGRKPGGRNSSSIESGGKTPIQPPAVTSRVPARLRGKTLAPSGWEGMGGKKQTKFKSPSLRTQQGVKWIGKCRNRGMDVSSQAIVNTAIRELGDGFQGESVKESDALILG